MNRASNGEARPAVIETDDRRKTPLDPDYLFSLDHLDAVFRTELEMAISYARQPRPR
jgi:hypothetical protein